LFKLLLCILRQSSGFSRLFLQWLTSAGGGGDRSVHRFVDTPPSSADGSSRPTVRHHFQAMTLGMARNVMWARRTRHKIPPLGKMNFDARTSPSRERQ